MVADRNAFHVNNGHPETDGLIRMAPIPGFICAVLAIVLGTAGIPERTSGRTWAIVGVIVETIAVAFTVSGMPVSMVQDSRLPQIP